MTDAAKYCGAGIAAAGLLGTDPAYGSAIPTGRRTKSPCMHGIKSRSGRR